MVPLPPFAAVIVVLPQKIPLPLAVTAVGKAFTDIVVVLELTLAGAAQPVGIIVHTTVLPLARVLLVNEDPLATRMPFTSHWYEGVPPFTGVGVKVTLVPEHIAPDGTAAILTDGVKAVNKDKSPKLLPEEPVVIPATLVDDEAYT